MSFLTAVSTAPCATVHVDSNQFIDLLIYINIKYNTPYLCTIT